MKIADMWRFDIYTIMRLLIIVEKYPDGYVAYPLEIKGVVVGEGETYEETLADVKSAIRFHIESFGGTHRTAG